MGIQSLFKKFDRTTFENILFVIVVLVLFSIFGYVISMPGDPPAVVAYVPVSVPVPVIEKQKVYRGTIIYKGESYRIELRETMEVVR